MEAFRQFTYWFMGINLILFTGFTFVAVVLGARDLYTLIRELKGAEVDDTDDGRVVSENVLRDS